jgi:hypothetical protein
MRTVLHQAPSLSLADERDLGLDPESVAAGRVELSTLSPNVAWSPPAKSGSTDTNAGYSVSDCAIPYLECKVAGCTLSVCFSLFYLVFKLLLLLCVPGYFRFHIKAFELIRLHIITHS